jgi:acyl-CoA synthetase (AMP-forming)/AMP-acid ligase II
MANDSQLQGAPAQQGLSGAGFHPAVHAQIEPNRPAIINADSGRVMTYAELDALSNQFAQLARRHGLRIGDTVAICLDNHPMYLPLAWGVERAGLIYVPISYRLTVPEIAYILEDSAAKLLFGFEGMASVLDQLRDAIPHVAQLRFGAPGDSDLARIIETMPASPIPDQRAGTEMLYSSGTTGRPKGVSIGLPVNPGIDGPHPMAEMNRTLFNHGPHTVYLSPAPMYHAAPLRFCMATHRLGGTVVVMDKFEAEAALAAIQKYRVTDSQWVPTHFIRVLA